MTEQSKSKVIVSFSAGAPGSEAGEGTFCTFTFVMPIGACRNRRGGA